jgi:hypothetical protein
MSLSLYSIADHYREAFHHLTDVLEETELSTQDKQTIIEDSLIELADDFKTKALNVAGFINNMKLEMEAIKTIENRLLNRRKSLENKINYLSDYLFIQCLKTGTTTIKNNELVIAIKNNPPKVIIDDEKVIPEIYKTTVQTINISKSSIASAIKAGIEITGAHLETSQRLDIR